MNESLINIKHHKFERGVLAELNNYHYAKDLWPVVYILSDNKSKSAYVGETTDTYSRLATHLKHNEKSKLTSIHLVASDKFNKSATLDIESNLIQYMSGDQTFKLLNANLGLANHNYYQKQEVYWDIFKQIWDKLRGEGIAKNSLESINNSDLFKYSPYKTLSPEQVGGLLNILQAIASNDFRNVVVNGGAGTGKTILAVFLFKLLSDNHDDLSVESFGADDEIILKLVKQIKSRYPKLKMALVIPMTSFRTTMEKVFKNIKGLTKSMVIGPAEVSRNKYDLIIVDESHRLRRRVNLGAYFRAFDNACAALGFDKNHSNELQWMQKQATTAVYFYDKTQSIKPSDVEKTEFNRLLEHNKTIELKLKTQFRVKGGQAYVHFVDRLLNCEVSLDNPQVDFKNYEFLLFDSIQSMVEQIKSRESESGLSRLVAGYSWEWKSKKNKDAFDIIIDNTSLKWNGTNIDWVNSANAVNEVGCIHTIQGYDLNYAGIIFGYEISYDEEKNEIVIIEENYFDRNGKQSINDPEDLKNFIINIYKTIMLRGIKGTYVYACDSKLQKYFESLIPKFQNEETNLHGIFQAENILPFENSVPLFDLKVAAGNFGDLQQVDDVQWIKLPDGIRPSDELFACQVIGESMNRIIPNGSYCLFRKDKGGSRNGKIVLVESTEITDSEFGSCYTIKDYESKKSEDEHGWKHQTITLKPRSFDSSFEKIILTDDELTSFKVVGIFECVI